MFVYAIYNAKNDKIYIGQTDNLALRLKMHNNKTFKTSFTSRFEGEWILVYSGEVKDRKEALIREKQLKSYRGRESIRKLLRK